PMAIGLSTAGVAALFLHIPVAVAAAVLGYLVGKSGGGQRFGPIGSSTIPWTWGNNSTGWASGGWSDGGWSTGGGGGGFSRGWGGFGGGSSGGGGATGSW